MIRVSDTRKRLESLLSSSPVEDQEWLAFVRAALEEVTNHPVPTTSARVIVLEGLDGVGKSTALTRLSSSLHAVSLCTPPKEILQWRNQFDAKEEEVRRCYYEVGNLLLSKKLRLAEKGTLIVVDRYWASTFAYETATRRRKGLQREEDVSPAIPWPSHLVPPQATFLLTLHDKERLARIAGREKQAHVKETAEEAELREKSEFRDLVKEQYLRVERVKLVDVTGLSEEAVTERLLLLLREEK